MCSRRNDISNTTQLENATHLIMLQHGLLGSKTDFARFMAIFDAHFPPEDFLYLHASESNASGFFQTYDGIDQGGERLANEIQKLTIQMPKLKKFSMIGHSLGGLYNRYCIGVLLSRGFFDKIEPMNFVTLATPHLGIRRPRRGATNAIFNALMQNIFSRTGAQLMLKDVATEETQVLSHSLKQCQDKTFHPAWSNESGSLLVRLPALEKQHDDTQEAFKLFDCVLSGRKLQVFESKELETDKNKLKLEIDLSCTDVQVLLPSGKSTGDDAKFFLTSIESEQKIEENGTSNESGNFDIQIRWPSPATKPVETHLCVLRIPEDKLHCDWKWLVAFCNASFGVRCLTSIGNTDVTKQQILTTSPLLSCMTRGQFMQALQMFKVRTLYSNIFFDLQVPYTCAEIRAFNPYRASANKCEMSSVYTHIAFDSLKSAEKVRDTIPDKVKRLAMELIIPERAAQASTLHSEEQPHNGHDVEISDNLSTESGSRRNCHDASDSRRKSAPVSSDIGQRRHFFSRRRGESTGNAPLHCSVGVRPVPFVDGDVILDQLPYAFRADTEQDELRGMLLSMQSVGWRRIDVLFGGIMAHEHIIAKRANVDKPLVSGIDIVHHVMDTFML
ncbi:hypothetical protein DD238_001587 [Peronospora effusa]|uniref:DUF676 domain-containing protein n=1 Tax=Peronospora effusa TaxID=542832 RepID=A0A3M6VMQ1_9STRA|nr:hypothetical protein DD238_001587 [Peronospora effusa]